MGIYLQQPVQVIRHHDKCKCRRAASLLLLHHCTHDTSCKRKRRKRRLPVYCRRIHMVDAVDFAVPANSSFSSAFMGNYATSVHAEDCGWGDSGALQVNLHS